MTIIQEPLQGQVRVLYISATEAVAARCARGTACDEGSSVVDEESMFLNEDSEDTADSQPPDEE